MAGWFAECPDATGIRDREESKSQNSSRWFRGGSAAGYESRSTGRTLVIALIVLPAEIREQSGVLPVGMGKIMAFPGRRRAEEARWWSSGFRGKIHGAQVGQRWDEQAGRGKDMDGSSMLIVEY